MNQDEAKYILRSYDLSGRDARDPQFREALERLKQDPELAAWFAQEQAIDTRLSEKFLAFPVPPDLKGQVLAARKIVPLPIWRRTTTWLGSAAALFVLFAVLLVFLVVPSEKGGFADFRNYVVQTAATLDHLDFRTTDLVQIRQWLESQRAPEEFVLPSGLNDRPAIGCRVFDWNGEKVSLICFRLENKKVAHLFVVSRSSLTKMPPVETLQFQTSADGIATASWADDSRIYVVAMERGEQDLKQLLL